MKVTKRIWVTAGLFLMGAAVLPAQNLKADIPFDFYAGDTKLQAGTYIVVKASESQAAHIFRLREESSKDSTMASLPIPVVTSSPHVSDTRMVFRCAQDECELSEIWNKQTGTKVRATPSRRLQGMNTEIASIVLKNGM